MGAGTLDEERRRLGSASRYTTSVKLGLEVRGVIERIPGAKPQRLRRVEPCGAPASVLSEGGRT